MAVAKKVTTKAATKKVTAPTYLQLISQDDKSLKKEALNIEAQKGSISVQRSIMELNGQIAQAKTNLASSQRQIPYSVKGEFKCTQELNALQEALEFAQAIRETRFTDVSI